MSKVTTRDVTAIAIIDLLFWRVQIRHGHDRHYCHLSFLSLSLSTLHSMNCEIVRNEGDPRSPVVVVVVDVFNRKE